MADNSSVSPTTIVDGGWAATTIVGATATTIVGDGVIDLTSVPPEVFARFPTMTPLQSGAEATVFTATDEELGPVVIKVYRRDRGETSEVVDLVERLSGSRTDHLAHLVRLFGAESIGGRWVEVLEWVTAGSLESFVGHSTPELLLDIVVEMTDALEYFHSLGLVHRDIKPANVLVRTREPLDLVLADFGLAAFASDALDLRAQDRTINYSSPETNSGVPGRPPADWWSLGVVLTELVVGRHPFDGLTDVEIVNHLAARDVDLSGVTDLRWQRLLAGLLTRDAAHRWGASEVRQWLAGSEPEVWRPSYAHPSYQFEGEAFRTARELAAGLGEKWSEAAALVGGSLGWSQLATWLIAEAPADASRAVRLDAVASTTDADARLFSLLRALAPDLVPVYRTFAIDAEGLAGLSASASVPSAPQANRSAVASLFANHALAARDAVGASLDDRWHREAEELTALLGDRHELDGAGLDLARARLLAAACSAEQERALRIEAERAAGRDLHKVDWYHDVASRAPTSNAAAVATLLLAPAAAGALRDHNAKERADKEDRRRQAHELTTERYPRTRRWLGWTTFAIGVLAVAALSGAFVRLPAGHWTSVTGIDGKVELLDGVLGSKPMAQAESTVPGLFDYLRFVFDPVWSTSLFGVGLVLWSRARRVGTATGPVRTEPERRAMQAAVVAGHALFPPLLPLAAVFTYRYRRSQDTRHPSPAQRRRRVALFVAATGLLLHSVAMLAVRVPDFGNVMFDFPSWYRSFLGNVPSEVFWTIDRAADLGWAMWLSFALAVVTYAIAIRSYGDVDQRERWAGVVLTILGIVAFVPGLLLAGFFPLYGAGIVIGVILAVVVGLYLLAMMLGGGD